MDAADEPFWPPDPSASEIRRRAEAFRGTARSLAREASQLLLSLRLGDEEMSDAVRERLHLLHYYLDRLIRLCDGEL
jgi:hypothetical protein